MPAAAQDPGDRARLIAAKREAAQAMSRSERIEREARRATGEAERARAEGAAFAARIEAAEADITAAEARIGLIEGQRIIQRARLAEKQGPVIRLTAALQMMARRPPALALVRPGSLDELVKLRSLLASTLPVIRSRTAALRAEIAEGDRLRRQADQAVAALTAGRGELHRRRMALADFERRQRGQSEALRESALAESDRALAFGEEARDLAEEVGSSGFRRRLSARLANLQGPYLRPGSTPQATAGPHYVLPVRGRLVTGMGEISDAGVHSRGLMLATAPEAPVRAPAAGRIAFAGPFRGYRQILIIDHGGGWTSAITNLSRLSVATGDRVAARALVGAAGPGTPRVSVELRRRGMPFPITPLIGS